MFKIVDGDVFSADTNVIVHGCNAFHAMHSGVAGIVRKEYPGAIQADLATPKGSRNKMGTYSSWIGPHARIPNKEISILNLYSQYTFGRDAVHADYKSIRKGMGTISEIFKDKIISFPFIGAGLAGGDPNTLLDIFVDVFKNTPNNVTLYLRSGEFPEIERKAY